MQSHLEPEMLNRLNPATFYLEVQERHGADIFSSSRHFRLGVQVIYLQPLLTHKESTMDEYQEELLEYHAFELDPLDPADDATEL
ncbi:hypothetical protein QF043_001951 [Pseudomonas sp. W3I7]|nr:hypothetical protein [Pseudomonas sp. W3I7]